MFNLFNLFNKQQNNKQLINYDNNDNYNNNKYAYFINKELFSIKFNNLVELKKLILIIKINIKFFNIINNIHYNTNDEFNILYIINYKINNELFNMLDTSFTLFDQNIIYKYFDEDEIYILDLIKSWLIHIYPCKSNTQVSIILEPFITHSLYNTNRNKTKIVIMLSKIKSLMIFINQILYTQHQDMFKYYNHIDFIYIFSNNIPYYKCFVNLTNVQLYKMYNLNIII